MNILLNLIMLGICLILIVLGMICATIRKDIKQNADIIAGNQQKLSRQIDERKESFKSLSSYERGRIDDIILALRTLGDEKLISYTEEINFLLKIRNW